MKLILLRHGKTVWNEQHKLQGQRNIPLSEEGENEAWLLHDALVKHGVKFEKIYTSPLIRAKKTAVIVTGKQTGEMTVVDELREMSFGVNEGIHYELGEGADLSGLSENMINFAENPGEYKAPEGGEEFSDVIERTGKFYKQILEENKDTKGNVLVVAHGASLHALIYNIEKKTDMNSFWEPRIGNCGIVEFIL